MSKKEFNDMINAGKKGPFISFEKFKVEIQKLLGKSDK